MAKDDFPNRLPSVRRVSGTPAKSVWRRGFEAILLVCVLLLLGTAILLAIKYLFMILVQIVVLLLVVALLSRGCARPRRDR